MKLAKLVCLATLLVGGSILSALADASPPERLTYQSFVVDANGQALGLSAPKNYDVVFRIWSDQASTDTNKLLWAEQQTVTIDKGYFSVLLGEGTVVPGVSHGALSALFMAPDASERYVEMTVKQIGSGNNDATIAPRLRFLTSPYAFLARAALVATSLANETNGPVLSAVGRHAIMVADLDVQGTVKGTKSAP